MHSQERACLFTVGGVTLLLLLVGIHNAWDAVTYHVFVRMQEAERDDTSEKDAR